MILYNIWLTAVGLLASGIAVASAAFVGAQLTSSRNLPLCFAFGAMVESVIITGLALSHFAYRPLIGAVVLLPCVRPVRFVLPSVALFAVLTPFLIYAFLMTGVNPIGGDLANYHLVIPRGVLWDNAFVFNQFSHEAGFSYGWHMFGVGTFLFGAERGYVLLSFWTFLLTCWLVFEVFGERYGDRLGLVAAFVTGFVICGLSRESIANDDGPLLLVEAVALFMLFSTRYAWGWLIGFALSIKFTAVGTPVALAVIRFARERSIKTIAVAALCALPIGAVWPLVNIFNTGSPLPQVMRPVLPQFAETMAFLTQGYGAWMRLSWFGQFSHGMIGLGLLLLVIPFGLLSRKFREDRLVHVLAAFAIVRFASVIAISRRSDVFWHDRYHLISFLALALIGLLAVRALFPKLSPAIVVCACGAATLVQFVSPVVQGIPTGANNKGVEYIRLPSMVSRMFDQLQTFQETPGASRFSVAFDWIAKELPSDAVIATTVVDPFYLRHHYIELLPLSQQQIDLSAPSETILAELRERGVTHLHLVGQSGFNVWMMEIISRWLINVRKIPDLPGVIKLASFMGGGGHGREDIYRIAGSEPKLAVAPFDPKVSIENHTAIIRWTPGDGFMRIYSGKILVGEVGAQFGEFWFYRDISRGMAVRVERDDGQFADLVAQ